MAALKAILIFTLLAPISIGLTYLGNLLGRIIFFVGRAYLFHGWAWCYGMLMGRRIVIGAPVLRFIDSGELEIIGFLAAGSILLVIGLLIAHLAMRPVRTGQYVQRVMASCFLSGMTAGVCYIAFLGIEELEFLDISDIFWELQIHWHLFGGWKMQDLSIAFLGLGVLLYGTISWGKWKKNQ